MFKDLLELVKIANQAGEELKNARIAEMQAEWDLSYDEAKKILAGIEGKTLADRDANLLIVTSTLRENLTAARKERAAAYLEYSSTKRALRVAELIYKVQAHD